MCGRTEDVVLMCPLTNFLTKNATKSTPFFTLGLDVTIKVPKYQGRTFTGEQEQVRRDVLLAASNDSVRTDPRLAGCNSAISSEPLSLRFNGHFPGEPGLAGVYWSKGWRRWCWHMDYWSYKSRKAPVKSSPPTNQHPVFLQAGCPSCRPTNSVKALEGKYHILWSCLPQAHLGVLLLCLRPLIAPGYLGYLFSCLLTTLGAIWARYPDDMCYTLAKIIFNSRLATKC